MGPTAVDVYRHLTVVNSDASAVALAGPAQCAGVVAQLGGRFLSGIYAAHPHNDGLNTYLTVKALTLFNGRMRNSLRVDRLQLLVCGIGISAGLGGIGVWGFSPLRQVQLKALYGNWETTVLLQKDYRSCSTSTTTDSRGKTKKTESCTTETQTLDSRQLTGYCVSVQDCVEVAWPQVPSEWSRINGQYMTSTGRFSIAYEDVEFGRGQAILLNYSQEEYQARMPQYLGLLKKTTQNRFRMYSKP